jgi:carboxypeptidase Q
MIAAGADTVFLEEVMVPHWTHKNEKAFIIEANNKRQEIPVVALGGSITTPAAGITAEIIEVHDFDELKKLGEENIKGKIVFYNHPFDQSLINTFEAYGEAVGYRWAGPSEASRYGAVATICRSMCSTLDDFPHTGAMRYNDSLPHIPCGAISTNAAELLSRILRANKNTKLLLKMECTNSDSVKSYNVIGEIRGSVFPNEYIVAGGHLDAWDTGDGAHDDGAGIVQCIEIIRIMKALNLRPQHTVRIIAFMNEENGLRGGRTYANNALAKKEKHLAAMESDGGGSLPLGFGLNMDDDKKAKVKKLAPLFLQYGLYDFDSGGDGADISPLENQNVPRMGLHVNSQRYFEYHHAATDTFDKVNKRELHLGAAAMAAMVMLLSIHGL